MKTTDRELRDAVMDALDSDDRVDTTHIGVIATEGAVTLTGFVRSLVQHRAAVRAAERVPGVGALADELELRPPNSIGRSDAEIAGDIARERHWNPLILSSLTVRVKGGHVTLGGDVDSDTQRREAERIVGEVRGVRAIENAVRVRPHPRPDRREIERRVDDAIRSMADTDARSIQATLEDGTVRLRGTVRSAAQSRAAEGAAASAPGVSAVVNELAVDA